MFVPKIQPVAYRIIRSYNFISQDGKPKKTNEVVSTEKREGRLQLNRIRSLSLEQPNTFKNKAKQTQNVMSDMSTTHVLCRLCWMEQKGGHQMGRGRDG